MGGSVFTPKQRNWRAYADAAGPTSPLANENVKPTLANNTDIIRLRISIAETGGKASNNAITILEYSTNQTDWFSLGAAAHWDHADGADISGNTITSLLLTDSSTSGRYCELASSTVTYPLSVVTESDFSVIPTANVSVETTYYFRTLVAGTAVPLDTAETYPQVLTTTAALPERTADLSVTLAGAVCAAAATLAATAILAVQLAGATVGSGATVPVVADFGKTLAGATLSATATAESAAGRIADLSVTLAGATVSSGVTAPVVGASSIQLAGAIVSSGVTAPVAVVAPIQLSGASLASAVTMAVAADLATTLSNASLSSTIGAPVTNNCGYPVMNFSQGNILSGYDDDNYPAKKNYSRGRNNGE